MILGTTRSLAFALLGCAALAHAAESIRIVETRAIAAPRATAATHDLTLHAYMFRGTRWSADEIAAALPQAARLLGPCGIALAAADVSAIDAPRRFHDYFTPASRELLRAIDVRKPAVFFVEDTRNQPAFDAEAIGRGNSNTRPELVNTVWVTYGARDLARALAHELVHVLADSGEHSDEPGNLMARETSRESNRLTAPQCELIRSRGEANGLLDRR